METGFIIIKKNPKLEFDKGIINQKKFIFEAFLKKFS